MSRLFSILLIGLYGLTLSQAYMPHVNYWMNRDFIASVLCENKDRPELECNGKCHLKKQIQENTEDQNEGQEVSNRLMVEFFQFTNGFELRTPTEISIDHFYNYSEPLTAGISTSVFHPPRV